MTSLIKYFFHLNAWFHHLKIIRSQLNVIVLNILDMLTIFYAMYTHMYIFKLHKICNDIKFSYIISYTCIINNS